jgi:hypothetical protein
MANAGRILIMPKGKYNAETIYEMLDMVSHGGKGWVCKQTCVGIEPAEGDYWAECIDVSGDMVGCYASETYGVDDMQNATEGTIRIVNRNGIITIFAQNLKCTASMPILDVASVVGDNCSVNDQDGTGFYIENSVLHSTKAEINGLVFNFAI